MKNLSKQIQNFQSNFCPYGYLDIERCVNIANQVEENEDWVFGIIEEFKDSICAEDYLNIDPVYCVYDSILQTARNEIEELTNVDILNDFENSLDCIYSNYLDTSYNASQDAVEELKKLLKKHKIKTKDLNVKTQWFIEEINN